MSETTEQTTTVPVNEMCLNWGMLNSVTMGCRATTIMGCNGGKPDCPFYVAPTAAQRAVRAKYLRIAQLPMEQQMQIAATYYDGKMPWRREQL